MFPGAIPYVSDTPALTVWEQGKITYCPLGLYDDAIFLQNPTHGALAVAHFP